MSNNQWKARHRMAMTDPQDAYERSFRDLLAGVDGYVNELTETYGRAVDGVLSPGLASIIEGIRTLLNGNVGRLDQGTIEAVLWELSYDIGWCLDDSQMFFECDRETCEHAARWHEENNTR